MGSAAKLARAFVRAQAIAIRSALQEWLNEAAPDLAHVGAHGADVCRRLADYSGRGKMIRGALVVAGYRLCRGDESQTALRGAAAIELLQSFLLIHDDIMDDDDLRRGRAAMHIQYATASQLDPGAARRLGAALAICAGDVAMMLSCELLNAAAAGLSSASQSRLMRLYAREVARIGVAQMDDVSYSYSDTEPDEAAILSLYRYKTGRYSFALPLQIGALLAGSAEHDAEKYAEKDGAPSGLLATIGALGEALGSSSRSATTISTCSARRRVAANQPAATSAPTRRPSIVVCCSLLPRTNMNIWQDCLALPIFRPPISIMSAILSAAAA